MFGRPLVEQVSADKQSVPVIVTKCINAVEAVGMEYEGIYRKTGGSSQSKQITLLFERGDYDAFDLADVDAFNDISSVTSVLKTYFRSLPNPLFTHELHESFVTAASKSSSHFLVRIAHGMTDMMKLFAIRTINAKQCWHCFMSSRKSTIIPSRPSCFI